MKHLVILLFVAATVMNAQPTAKKPITHDVIDGAYVEVFYALICARLGMIDEAVGRIERLLTRQVPPGIELCAVEFLDQLLRALLIGEQNAE